MLEREEGERRDGKMKFPPPPKKKSLLKITHNFNTLRCSKGYKTNLHSSEGVKCCHITCTLLNLLITGIATIF